MSFPNSLRWVNLPYYNNTWNVLSRVLQQLQFLVPRFFQYWSLMYCEKTAWKTSLILWENWWNPENPKSIQDLIEIIKTAGFKEEPMRTLDGTIVLQELLINFSKIPEEYRSMIFTELKKDPDGTFLLFCLSLEAAKERILRWEAVSINAFVEDFDHRDFHKTMLDFFNWENINPRNIQQRIDPNLLTIELLEDHRHRNLSQGIIEQLKRVQSLGIHLAIDDYSFESEKFDHTKNQSRLIMLSLIRNDVPFRIKVDGGILSAVFPIEWHRNMVGNKMKDHYPSMYDEQRVNQRDTIISEIKNYLERWIYVTLEWVIPAQLSIIRETFWSPPNLLVQGMELQQKDFVEEM